MNELPQENFSPVWTASRPVVPSVGDERAILTGLLDWQRATFESKCAGVPVSRLSELAVPPSTMSLHGILRHLSACERWWFQIQFAGSDVPMLYYSDDDPDQDFTSLDGDVAAAFSVWHQECDVSRSIVAARGLDDTGVRRRTGEAFSLRRLLVDMIAEYARHNGHADLLRERLDGATGW